MSLQETARSHIIGGQEGLKREINKNSEKMVLDILQVTQYSKPIQSTVRELASNAVDSQREKEIAIEILEGKASPEDYFYKREGDEYKDSQWTPQYYDLNHLDLYNNRVSLEYMENIGTGFIDQFIVTDHGVGLGEDRLIGYFQLGYSSKRNSASQLGAYGLGAKSPLSTGADHYTVETVHNGKKFRFNCFAYKVDSLIPRFNAETEQENKKFNLIADPDKPPYWAYYEETEEKNYTKVITKVKRHNRERFKQAIKHQLLYFKGVDFIYKHEDGSVNKIPFKAKILHNSDNLIVSDTYQFSRPHIVVVKETGSTFGVTYGTIDFQELEMQALNGSVGFKCPIRAVDRNPVTGEEVLLQDGVSVTPNRESILWDNHTRNYIEKIIKNAQQETSNLISKELKEKDFVTWLTKANDIINSASRTAWGQSPTALNILSKLVDKSALRAVYQEDKSIKFSSNPSKFFWGFQAREIFINNGKYDSTTGSYIKEVERRDLSFWGNFDAKRIYYLIDDDKPSPIKDRYLWELHNSSPFTLFKKHSKEHLIEEATKLHGPKGWEEKRIAEWVDTKIAIRDKIWEYLTESSNAEVKYYPDIEVPESFEKKVQDEIDKKKTATLSPAERRELQGKVVCYTYQYKDGTYGSREYRLEKKEPVIGNLGDVDGPVIYGTQKHDPLFYMLALFFHQETRAMFFTPDYFCMKDKQDKKLPIKFLRFSKRNLKYIKNNPNFIKIENYMWNKTKTEYSVGDFFISFFTARYIKDRLKELQFLRNFEVFSLEIAKSYELLETYCRENFSNRLDSTLESNFEFIEFVNQAEKIQEFQLFLIDNPGISKDKIQEKSKELFDTDTIEKAQALDMDIINLLSELEDFSQAIGPLFNAIEFLTKGKNSYIPEEAESLIRQILENQGLDKFKLTENSINFINKC